MKNSEVSLNLFIAVISLVVFLPFIGSTHLFDWDEINFAECAREMIVSNNYYAVMIDFIPFWEKPPLFIWMQVLSMKLFGINEFAARFPNAICGIITMFVLFNTGKKLYSLRFGVLWALIYAGSFLPHFYFKSGIIDPWFNLFIFCSIYFLILFTEKDTMVKKYMFLMASASLLGLAVLTKGPVAVLLFFLCCLTYWILKRFKKVISVSEITLFLVVLILIGGAWFIVELLNGRKDIILEFVDYQIRLLNTADSGHGGSFLYHFVVLFFGCFPASIIAIKAFKGSASDNDSQKNFKTWMFILLSVVLIVFTIVKTKIIHYSSLCYFPLTFFAAYTLNKIFNNEMAWKKWMSFLILIIGFLLGTIITVLPWVESIKKNDLFLNVIHDRFLLAALEVKVSWDSFDFIIGPVYIISLFLIFIVFKKLGVFRKNVLLFTLNILFVEASIISIVPKVEKYLQGSAIEFYEHISHEDCYVETIGFKSYAHLFYAQTKESQNPGNDDISPLLNAKVDKPAYFVSRINFYERNKEWFPQLTELYKKGGFVFYKKE